MEKWEEKKTISQILAAQDMVPSKIKSIRSKYGLYQEDFAALLDISYHTYKNWEIGHRKPCTSAVALLTIAEKNPNVFLKKRKEILKLIKLLKG